MGSDADTSIDDVPGVVPRSPISTVTITTNRETGERQIMVHNFTRIEVLNILHMMAMELELAMTKELAEFHKSNNSTTPADSEG